jgi:hypothetical protein
MKECPAENKILRRFGALCKIEIENVPAKRWFKTSDYPTSD